MGKTGQATADVSSNDQSHATMATDQ